uniref:Reverse transcriptase n=1 Tax=Cannabis sativa TaxID=3483 RepID=A0A803PLH7_CANSA
MYSPVHMFWVGGFVGSGWAVPPKLGYKDTFRAPVRTLIKKNPFDLSNSTPIEEYLSCGSSSDQVLQLFATQGEDQNSTSNILSRVSNHLSLRQSLALDSPFTTDEIKNALFNLSGDKAPRSDGLNAYFYRKNWHTLGKDLCKAILDVLNNHSDISPVKETILVLILKKKNASTFSDFRPISLCSTLYKIISK